MDGAAGADGESSYDKRSTTRDNAVNSTTEFRETAPGGVQKLHVGIMIDNGGAVKFDTNEISDWVAAATGIDEQRGDTVRVSAMPFDTSTQDALAKELEQAAAADAAAKRNAMLRDGALIQIGRAHV